jgi:hypothetical protein
MGSNERQPLQDVVVCVEYVWTIVVVYRLREDGVVDGLDERAIETDKPSLRDAGREAWKLIISA